MISDDRLTSANTNGLGFITVHSDGTTTCTPRLKTGAVLHQAGWLVQNDTDAQISVDLRNFTLQEGAGPLSINWVVAPPVSVGRHGKAVIVGLFDAGEGDLYKYDVYVNGELALDPQLEI